MDPYACGAALLVLAPGKYLLGLPPLFVCIEGTQLLWDDAYKIFPAAKTWESLANYLLVWK